MSDVLTREELLEFREHCRPPRVCRRKLSS